MRRNNCTFTCSRSAIFPLQKPQLPILRLLGHPTSSHSSGEKEQELEQRYAQTRRPGRSVLVRMSKKQTCFHFSPGWDKEEGTSFACMPNITELLGSYH